MSGQTEECSEPPHDEEDWYIKARKRTGGDNATCRHLGEGHIEAHKLVTRVWQKPELMEQAWEAPEHDKQNF